MPLQAWIMASNWLGTLSIKHMALVQWYHFPFFLQSSSQHIEGIYQGSTSSNAPLCSLSQTCSIGLKFGLQVGHLSYAKSMFSMNLSGCHVTCWCVLSYMNKESASSTIYSWIANTGKKLKVNKLNITLYEREYFRNSFTLQTIRIISKNTLNKSCSKLNFPQRTQRTHISISFRSGPGGLQRFPFLISYNVLEGGSRFTLGLNAANNMDYIGKCFK